MRKLGHFDFFNNRRQSSLSLRPLLDEGPKLSEAERLTPRSALLVAFVRRGEWFIHEFWMDTLDESVLLRNVDDRGGLGVSLG